MSMAKYMTGIREFTLTMMIDDGILSEEDRPRFEDALVGVHGTPDGKQVVVLDPAWPAETTS